LNGKVSELSSKNRVFSPEFRIEVAKRILKGESVTSVHRELGIKRSVLYRWVHAYGEEGEQGLRRPVGRPTGPGIRVRRPSLTETEQLQQQVAELERKVGQQAMQLDFFRGAFK